MALEFSGLRIAQTVGIIAPALLGGMNIGMSSVCLPAAIRAATPETLARVWSESYYPGFGRAMASLALSVGSWVYVMYAVGFNSAQGPLVATVLGLTVVQPLYTRVLMLNRVNARLLSLSGRVEKGEKLSEADSKFVREQVVLWNNFNLGRVAISTVTAVIGIMTLW